MILIEPGALRERVALQSRTQSPNAATGNLDDAYTTVATVAARVETISGGRYIAGQQTETVATHRITTRWRSGYEAIRFLGWGGRRFEVRSVRDLAPGTRRFLEWLVEEARGGV
jgi:SPP1 family predicted phage head-tail adaptor